MVGARARGGAAWLERFPWRTLSPVAAPWGQGGRWADRGVARRDVAHPLLSVGHLLGITERGRGGRAD